MCLLYLKGCRVLYKTIRINYFEVSSDKKVIKATERYFKTGAL